MVKILKLQPENADAEFLPPTFYLKFSQEEFPSFLANPTTTLQKLGYTVKNLTVTVKDHVWDACKQEWIIDQTDRILREAPIASQWEWWCGYQDEMCVCERVLVP